MSKFAKVGARILKVTNYFIIMEQEIWKDVKGYEGLYQVSNLGNVKRFPYTTIGRTIGKRSTYIKRFKGGILHPTLANNGYFVINLTKNSKQKIHYIHRLVAEAFLENHRNYPCINHKDECKTNNNVNNLEWCTYAYNNQYNGLLSRASIKRRSIYARPIRITRINDGFTKSFDSQYCAADFVGTTISMILRAANKGRKTIRGYIVDFITH